MIVSGGGEGNGYSEEGDVRPHRLINVGTSTMSEISLLNQRGRTDRKMSDLTS